MKGNLIKVITLVVLIILVIITFDLTNKNQETGLINDNNTNKSSSNTSLSDDKKEDNETIIDDKEDKEDNNEIVEEESNIIKQYKLFNKYIVTSENTEYKEVDYKYFIIRSYSEFEKYINEYLIEYNTQDSEKYETYNAEIKEKILKEFDKDFFTQNSVILLSDVNSRKQINGNISEIAKGDEGLVDLKIKKEDNENLTNSITYIIPIEKGIKQVKAKHIN